MASSTSYTSASSPRTSDGPARLASRASSTSLSSKAPGTRPRSALGTRRRRRRCRIRHRGDPAAVQEVAACSNGHQHLGLGWVSIDFECWVPICNLSHLTGGRREGSPAGIIRAALPRLPNQGSRVAGFSTDLGECSRTRLDQELGLNCPATGTVIRQLPPHAVQIASFQNRKLPSAATKAPTIGTRRPGRTWLFHVIRQPPWLSHC